MSYDFLGFIRPLPPQSVKITWGQSWHDKTSDTFSSFVSPIWGKICVLQALDWILLEHSERKTVPPYRIGPVKIEWQESILNFACFSFDISIGELCANLGYAKGGGAFESLIVLLEHMHRWQVVSGFSVTQKKSFQSPHTLLWTLWSFESIPWKVKQFQTRT